MKLKLAVMAVTLWVAAFNVFAGKEPIQQNSYTTNLNIPVASTTVLGSVEVDGSSIASANGVLSVLGFSPGSTNNPSFLQTTNIAQAEAVKAVFALAVTNIDIVRNYGAVSGNILRNPTIATGSTNLVVSNYPFTANSVGMVVELRECGPNTNCFATTCYSYINQSNIILSAPVPQGITNGTSYFNGPGGNPVFGYTAENGIIGPDNTAAFQAAINLIINGSVSIHVPYGNYVINGPVGGTNISQLYVPPIPASMLVPPVLKIYGDDVPALNQRTLSNSLTALPGGTVIYSTVPILTNGIGQPGSMIDCRNYSSPVYTANLPFNAVVVDVENLRIRGCFDNGGCLLNLGGAWNEVVKNVSIDSGYVNYCNPRPQNTNTWGLYLTPPSSDGTVLLQGSIIIDGFYNGMDFGEHTSLAGNLFVGDCWNAFNTFSFYTSSNTPSAYSAAWSAGGISSIPAYLHGVDAEHNKFYIQNQSGKIGNLNMDITHIENSFAGDWTMPPVLLNDPNGGLAGYIYYSSSLGSALLITNGANVELHAYGNYLASNTNSYENTIIENTSNLTAQAFQMVENGPFGISIALASGNVNVQDNSILLQSIPSASVQWVFGKHPEPIEAGSFFWKAFVNGTGTEVMTITTNGNMVVETSVNTSNLTATAEQLTSNNSLGLWTVTTNGEVNIYDDSMYLATSAGASVYWQVGKHPQAYEAGSLFWKVSVNSGVSNQELMTLTTNGNLTVSGSITTPTANILTTTNSTATITNLSSVNINTVNFTNYNYILIQTNSSIIAPTAIIGYGILWNSNDFLYWVTQFHTNYIGGP